MTRRLILARRDADTFIATGVIAISMIFLVFLYPHHLCEKIISVFGGFTMIIIVIMTFIIVGCYHQRIAKKKLKKLDQRIF